MPIAPGTFGTLIAAIFYILFLQHVSLTLYIAVLFVLIFFGIWLCHVTARDLDVHDHPGIVWDEFAGYLLTMLLAPAGWIWVLVGFFFFRFFDIVKPWPVGWLDKNISGGLGIMLDDIAAGVYAWLGLQLVYFIVG